MKNKTLKAQIINLLNKYIPEDFMVFRGKTYTKLNILADQLLSLFQAEKEKIKSKIKGKCSLIDEKLSGDVVWREHPQGK